MGPGIFRANPNLLNRTNYKILIDNVIRFTIIDSLKDKNLPLYHQILTHFIEKITIQEEISTLEIVTSQYKWKVNDRIKHLEEQLATSTQLEIVVTHLSQWTSP